jgi:hypothetical protein
MADKKELNLLKDEIISINDRIADMQDMMKLLNAKLDLFKNLEPETRENISAGATNKGKNPLRASVFKTIFAEDQEAYIGILYTREELDEVMVNPEVTKKRKQEDKLKKAADIIFHSFIKNNTQGRNTEFENIYNKFVKGE